MSKIKAPDPFALEVTNNECIAAIARLNAAGKKIFQMRVVDHGYVLQWYLPVRNNSSNLVELLLDYGCNDDIIIPCQ